MAHTARISSTVDLLITSITGLTPSDPDTRTLKDSATKTLRSNTHVRANQFDVRSKYQGLIEKFSILNREDLAEALQKRWDELPERPTQWQPEVLSLLLHLSDRPLEKTDVDAALKSCRPPEPESTGPTWEEIIADDPFSDDELWKDVERGYHSSGDDATVDGEPDSDSTTTTQATSVQDDFSHIATSYLMLPDSQSLVPLELTKERLNTLKEGRSHVSELWMIREVLSMLHGLPTTLFVCGTSTATVKAQCCFVSTTSSASTTDLLLSRVADLGTSLRTLRDWTRDPAMVAITSSATLTYIRTLQTEIAHQLVSLDLRLAEIEQRFLQLMKDVVVSFLQIYDEIMEVTAPLVTVARIVAEAARQLTTNPFSYLDLLHDEICIAQLAGVDQLVISLATLLFSSTKTYLRSLATWTYEGRIEGTGDLLFVEEAHAGTWALSELWTKRFRIKRRPDGSFWCPRFMQDFIEKIFAMGKSQAFLLELNKRQVECAEQTSSFETFPPFTWPSDTVKAFSFLPFSELFSNALQTCLSGGAPDPVNTLRAEMLHGCGLLELVESMQHLYHAKDGGAFQSFANALQHRMDTQPQQWDDSFLLTELAQETLGTAGCIDASRIAVRSTPVAHASKDSKPNARALGDITLTYELPWPIRNITHEVSLAADAKVFALLLRIYRAEALLKAEYYDIRTSRGVPAALTRLLPLRQRLLWFVTVLYTHITTTTFILSSKLRADWASALDIDAMAAAYADYVRRLETSLLLTSNLNPLRETVAKLLELCERFDDIWQRLNNVTSRSTASTQKQRPPTQAAGTLRAEMDKHLRFLVAGIRSVSRAKGESALETLAERLEWNSGL